MLLGMTPLVLVHFSFRSYLRIREEAQKTFEKVVQLLEERDPYTGEHSGEVADLAGEIAQELGLRGSEVEMIKAVARVHDIGKIAVPDRILLKPGKLDPEEWEIMKRHTEIGADLLKGLEVYGRYADVVRYEHEHWDGTGYPNGLQGEEIPIAARIIAAADVYHALISDRPYRPAYSHEEALDIIRNMAGRVLDPKVVGALLRVLERWKAEELGEKK
jgi:putative nucleotidyltransferase with HDIG domain